MSTNDLLKNKKSPLPPLKKQRLGRGLGSLLGEKSQPIMESRPTNEAKNSDIEVAPIEVEESQKIERKPSVDEKKFRESRIWQIDIEKLAANRQQPRKHFEKEKLKELSDSIRLHGVMSPIVARKKKEGGFEIIAGERRWRASQMAGLKQVPVIFKEIEDKKSLELALIENIQRHDLNPIEEGLAYKKLMEEYGLTQEEAAKRLGKERSTIANAVRLLLLPPEVSDYLIHGKITQGHAKVLLSLGDSQKQIDLAHRIVDEQMNVRNTEKAVKELLQSQGKTSLTNQSGDSKSDLSAKLAQQLKEDLQKVLGTKVEIDYKNSKGKVSLYFYSDDQLNQMTDRLKEAWRS